MQYESFDKDKFHVVTMISNPVRYKSRYNLFFRWQEHMRSFGIEPWVIELQTGDRPFCITDKQNPRHLQRRAWDELWHKENCLNLIIQKLPCDWETVAWIDADIRFTRADWVEETLHQLQIYQVVQLWETAVDFGPNEQVLSTHKSFMSQYIKRGAVFPETSYQEWHPGYAWAARREAIDGMGSATGYGPLFSTSILGAGDRVMALAFVGAAHHSIHPDTTAEYKLDVMTYQKKCLYTLRRDVGFVGGTIMHWFHGKKKDRKYWDRWKILTENQFNPFTDIRTDSYGTLMWVDDMTDRMIRMRDQVRAYFRNRNEDSIDLE